MDAGIVLANLGEGREAEIVARINRIPIAIGTAAAAEDRDADGAPPLVSQARSPRLLLRMLRAAQPITRVELARRLELNRSTVTDIMKPLVAAGIVVERPADPGLSRVPGRPALSLSFNLDRGDIFAGVNIGVRQTQVGLGDLGHTVLAEEEFATPAEPDLALAQIRTVLEGLRSRWPKHTLRFVGVSVPGPADVERRSLVYAPHLGWTDVAIAEVLRIPGDADSAPVPVIVDNDSTAAAMYEARLRTAQGLAEGPNEFILVRSGTGIGVGLVLDGEVYRGSGSGRGVAGEFGHMTIMAGGKPCACGNRGCWERYASASSAAALYVGDRLQLGGAPPLRFVEIVARAEAGELRAQRTLERIGEYLGIGIRNVIMGLGVPRVIVSGRVVYGWRFIREPLRQAIEQSMAGILPGWSVEAGEPRGAGLGGALELAADEYLTTTLVSYLSTGRVRSAVA
jgi:predicted NBD/HSP70 family sugar kinase